MRRLDSRGQQGNMVPTGTRTSGVERINRLALKLAHEGVLIIHLVNGIGLLDNALGHAQEARAHRSGMVRHQGGARIRGKDEKPVICIVLGHEAGGHVNQLRGIAPDTVD